jgi:nucleotide-binding universal stress UspA family protein
LSVQPRLVQGEAAGALLEVATSASLLVLGSHGRGWIGSALVGSVSQQCVTHAALPVVVVPANDDITSGHGRVVVGVDGSDGSYGALHFAVEEAGRRRARLDVVHVWHQPEPIGPLAAQMWAYRASAEEASTALVETMTARVRAASASHAGPASIERISMEGQPSRALVSCARGADLLVVGARGRGGFTGLLLGSVSLRCLHHAPCPIAVVHVPRLT